MYFLMNLITPGKLLMMLVILATIAKNPITSDEVNKVTIDNPQTEIRSICFMLKLNLILLNIMYKFHHFHHSNFDNLDLQ